MFRLQGKMTKTNGSKFIGNLEHGKLEAAANLKILSSEQHDNLIMGNVYRVKFFFKKKNLPLVSSDQLMG